MKTMYNYLMAIRLHLSIVWRDHNGRISWSTAWKVAKGVWLQKIKK